MTYGHSTPSSHHFIFNTTPPNCGSIFAYYYYSIDSIWNLLLVLVRALVVRKHMYIYYYYYYCVNRPVSDRSLPPHQLNVWLPHINALTECGIITGERARAFSGLFSIGSYWMALDWSLIIDLNHRTSVMACCRWILRWLSAIEPNVRHGYADTIVPYRFFFWFGLLSMSSECNQQPQNGRSFISILSWTHTHTHMHIQTEYETFSAVKLTIFEK